MTAVEEPAKGELARGWRTLVGATGAAATGLQLFVYTNSYFVKPLQEDMGWTRGEISAGVGYAAVVSACFLPVMGVLTDRYGAKRVGTVGLAGYGLMCLALAMLPPSLMLFYAALMVLGAVYTAASLVVFAPLVARQFDKRRGLALGINLSGASILLIPLAPLLTNLIATAGWRAGYASLGGLALVVGLPCLWLAASQTPFVRVKTERGAAWTDFRSVLATRDFWQIMIAALCGGAAVGGFLHHLQPIASDKGYSTTEIGLLASFFVVMVAVGRTVMGILLDLLRPQAVAAAVLLAAAGGALLMRYGPPSLPLSYGVMVLVGGAMGAEADIHAFFVARRFGLARFATLFSVISTVVFAALGFGGALFGAIFDTTQSYDGALLAACGLFIASAVLFGTVSLKPPGEAAPAKH